MIRPAGESSDEDEFADFMSDDDDTRTRNKALDHREYKEVNAQLQIENKIYTNIVTGNFDYVVSLLDNGFDVNTTLKDGWTPLLLAASVGEPDITREFLKRGANVNISKDYYTPLMAASSCPECTSPFHKSLDVVTQLINGGGDVNAKTRKRMTALMYAASNGNVEIVKKLLPLSDINAEDNQGWTALFWAVNDNCLEVVKLLIKAGLKCDKYDVRTNTPLHYAKENGFQEIVDILPFFGRNKKSINSIQQIMYRFDELFEEERPNFFRDVCVLLYGMNNERNTKIFLNNNVDLVRFLSLTEKDLQELGITKPYERYKIMSGLYKFHKHLYKSKSLPIVAKDMPYSSFDVGKSLTSACRQFLTMEASLKYLLKNTQNMEDLKNFNVEIRNIKRNIFKVKNVALTINAHVKEWDLETQKVDLITKDSYKKIKKMKYKSVYTVTILSLIAFVIVRKMCSV